MELVGVNNLDQLTFEMVKEFFKLYGLAQLPEDRKNRKKVQSKNV